MRTPSLLLLPPLVLLLVVVCTSCAPLVSVESAPACLFAPSFDADELFHDPAVQEQFVETVMQREGQFLQPNPCASTHHHHAHDASGSSGRRSSPDYSSIGYHVATGMTLDGHRWTVDGGVPLGEPHLFTAASKESLHLSMLALALSGNSDASRFIAPNDPAQAETIALEVLATKVNTLDAFFETFPGFGGFLPWVYVSDEGLTPTADFNSSVPSLDNGQMFWGAYAVAHVLTQNYSTVLHRALERHSVPSGNALYLDPATTLAARWTNVWQRMVDNALIVFYDDRTNTTLGQFRTVSLIGDRTKAIDPSVAPGVSALNYAGVPGAGGPSYLDDPYEGELFTNMAYLLGDWSWTGASPASVWLQKRAMLEPVQARVQDRTGQWVDLTVQRGYWFSGHEQWKMWLNPYSLSEHAWRVFLASEKARTWHSVLNGLGGGFASAAGMAETDQADTGYVSDCGIPSLAFETVSNTDILTPYAFAALMMASRSHGLAWYHNILLSDRAQTCFGSIEALNRTGANFAPLGTWDTKVTTLVALTGGIGPLVAEALSMTSIDMNVHGDDASILGSTVPLASEPSALDLLVWALDSEWSRVFGTGSDDDVDFQRPAVRVPQLLGPFTSCTSTSHLCQCTA